MSEQASLLDLIGNDPRHDDEYERFLRACELVSHPYGDERKVSINSVRRIMRNQWGLVIDPRRYSSFWRRARLDGHLERTGDWETNTDAKGRNNGKPQPVYRWVGAR
jgi:hypothetical protein